ncbi:MAG: Asp-tRNA(Asn)/Glu-tRNA(Gln) amidotransferase GatCAB subunit B, partial [Candidatus Omnitrophica bacterium]|nr:Asp-tRNA(Asn)/Glu-tRNA(Gln) amidotransferase GatCAB subunit B [Candidatus Omnitrophota bacterium]
IKKQRLMETYNLSFKEARFVASEKKLADYFESCISFYSNPKAVYNWIAGPLMAEMNERKINIEEIKILPQELTGLIRLVEENKISNLKAKEILKKMFDTKKSYLEIIEEEKVSRISDFTVLEEIVRKVVEENPKSVQDYKSGKTTAIMFLVGQVMKKTGKNADPQLAQKILKEILDNKIG